MGDRVVMSANRLTKLLFADQELAEKWTVGCDDPVTQFDKPDKWG